MTPCEPVLTRAQSRAFDTMLIETAHLPGLVLMENAGRVAAERARRMLGESRGEVLVVAGTGNNGGDGCALARHLARQGHPTQVWLVGSAEAASRELQVMLAAWRGTGGTFEVLDGPARLEPFWQALNHATLIVDAYFGTGLTRPLEGWLASVVLAMNESARPILALDLPSGLDADRGAIHSVVVRATETVAFGAVKLGCFTPLAVEQVGRVHVADLGAPAPVADPTLGISQRFSLAQGGALLARRLPAMHKGRAGRVAVVAGSVGAYGAAHLAARGALRGGAGLVTHVGRAETIRALEAEAREAMTFTLPANLSGDALRQQLSGMDAVVMGPGLGLTDDSRLLCKQVLEAVSSPLVLDADALTWLAREPSLLSGVQAPLLLTPHAGELARLLGNSVDDCFLDWSGALQRLCDVTGATVLLKGPYTFVGRSGCPPTIAGEPCPVLATGGSGDVLAGLLGALLVDLPAQQAAVAGASVHVRGAQLWQAAHGGADRGMLASELADALPSAIAELSAR